jgi:hypothetical protein
MEPEAAEPAAGVAHATALSHRLCAGLLQSTRRHDYASAARVLAVLLRRHDAFPQTALKVRLGLGVAV